MGWLVQPISADFKQMIFFMGFMSATKPVDKHKDVDFVFAQSYFLVMSFVLLRVR